MINKTEIIKFLGEPRKRIGAELIWRCPYCVDKHGDNLHYNEKKNILWCFANEEHSKEILREIAKLNKKEKPMSKAIPQYLLNKESYTIYQDICNSLLMGTKTYLEDDELLKTLWSEQEISKLKSESQNSDKALNYLYAERKINPFVVELCGLGFDFVDSKWVIPIYNQNKGLVGFEYRKADFKEKKIWREIDTPKCLAHVYGKEKTKECWIVEGFFDAYALLALAIKNNKENDISIFTPSNGVNATIDSIKELSFNNYEHIYLCLDNDKAGNEMTERVISAYPFICDKRGFLRENKDINQFLINVI